MKKFVSCFIIVCFCLSYSGIANLPATASDEIDAIGPADVRYIVSDIRETVQAGGIPETGTLILLDAMKDQVAIQLSTAEASYQEAKGGISDADRAEIDPLITEGAAKTNRLIAEISAVIATPITDIGVEQLDAIILLLDESADMQGDILSAKPDLPNE
jgi:hypothetical protein